MAEVVRAALGALLIGKEPRLTLTRWDEVSISAILQDTQYAKANVVQEGGIVKWVRPGWEVWFYLKGHAPDNPDGGYEFEIHLKQAPPTNRITLNINTTGLNFYYQGPLNREAKHPDWATVTETEAFDSGGKRIAYRPPHVVGSYAVYHATKRDHIVGKTNYGTGKAFHIYRPEAIDALGKRTWCDLAIDTVAGTMTISVPAAWLNSATYPVVIDPTFGYTTVGATNAEYYTNYEMAFGPYTPAANGNASSVSFFFGADYHAAFSATFGIFSDTGSDAPNANLKDTAGGNVGNPEGVATWYSQDLDSVLAVTSGTLYWIVRNSADTFHYRYDTVTGYDYVYDSATYSAGTLRSSYGTPDGKLDNWRHSCYVTYAEAGGGTLYYQSCAGGMTPTGSIHKRTTKLVFAGGITPAGGVAKVYRVFKTLAGGITPTGALSRLVTYAEAVAGSITPTGALRKLTSKRVGGSITPTGSLALSSTAIVQFVRSVYRWVDRRR